MKKVFMTILVLASLTSSALAAEVKVCSGTDADPIFASCGPGITFTQRLEAGYRLASVLFANGKFHFYLSK
jgi:hypothetical protein